jgi:hypothetical protein
LTFDLFYIKKILLFFVSKNHTRGSFMSNRQKTEYCIKEFVNRYPSILNVRPAQLHVINSTKNSQLLSNSLSCDYHKENWASIKREAALRQALRKIIIQTLKNIGAEIGRAPTMKEVEEYFSQSGCKVRFKYIIYNLRLTNSPCPYSHFLKQAGY